MHIEEKMKQLGVILTAALIGYSPAVRAANYTAVTATEITAFPTEIIQKEVDNLKACKESALSITAGIMHGLKTRTSCIDSAGQNEMDVTCEDPERNAPIAYMPVTPSNNIVCKALAIPVARGGLPKVVP